MIQLFKKNKKFSRLKVIKLNFETRVSDLKHLIGQFELVLKSTNQRASFRDKYLNEVQRQLFFTLFS